MRALLTLTLLGLAAFAAANAAMGYALEQYDRQAWFAYVGLTVVFEAWAIGRWAGFGWPKAVGVSVLANLVTAFCCANLCGVGLHQSFVGSRLNPDPLLNMVVMFTVFGALSGWIESVVWRLCGARRTDDSTALRSIGAHLAWAPLGVAIMLVPARPYPMLEAYTRYARRFYLEGMRRTLGERVEAAGRVPTYSDAFACFAANRPANDDTPDAWAALYRPEFGRFSTGQTKGEAMFEWNVRANGLRLDAVSESDRIWLLRTVRPEDGQFGLYLDQGGIEVARNSMVLGETTTIPAPSAPARRAPPAAARSRPKG